MRMPRLTTRALIIAIAAVGLVIGLAFEGSRRRARFLALAEAHRDRASQWMLLKGDLDPESDRRLTELWRARVGPTHDHQEALREKYERAARFPWLAVSPDPPDPPTPDWPPGVLEWLGSPPGPGDAEPPGPVRPN